VEARVIGPDVGEESSSAGPVGADPALSTPEREEKENVPQVAAQIDGNVVAGFPESPHQAGELQPCGQTGGDRASACSLPPRSCPGDDLIYSGMRPEQFGRPWATQDIELARSKSLPKRAQHSGGHRGITDVVTADDQDLG
jgi:hypothetical protein